MAGLVVLAVVFVVAAAVRLRMLFQPSPFFFGTYDDGVHFAVALNLLHGQIPYRDVLFLHPPGIALATSPFAAVAPLTGDARAFVLARYLKVSFAPVGLTLFESGGTTLPAWDGVGDRGSLTSRSSPRSAR